MDIQKLLESLLKIITSYKFYVPLITIIVSLIIISGSKNVINRVIKNNKNVKTLEAKRKNTLATLMDNIVKYLILIIAFLVILSSWGVNVTAFVTGLGVVGIVAGLAIQDALRDIIMGFNIIFDNYFVVGDLVTYNGFTGEVIEFGLKNTKIKDFEGTVLIVANRNISEIKNLSQKNSSLLITIPTAYEADNDDIEKVIKNICGIVDKSEYAIGKTEFLGINSLSSSSVDYLIKAHCKATDQFTFKRVILGIVKREFDANSVKIPYNQIEVHNG